MSIDFLINSDSWMGYTGSDVDDNFAILWVSIDERVLRDQGHCCARVLFQGGVDNSHMAEITYPRLTTVAQPIKTITRKDFSLWNEAFQGEACLGLHRLETRFGGVGQHGTAGRGKV